MHESCLLVQQAKASLGCCALRAGVAQRLSEILGGNPEITLISQDTFATISQDEVTEYEIKQRSIQYYYLMMWHTGMMQGNTGR